MLELYACGSNAWNQLQFLGYLPEEPQDIAKFTCILRDEEITEVFSGLSSTLVKTSSRLCLAGMPDELAKHYQKKENIFGRLAEAGNGRISNSQLHEFKTWSEYLGSSVSNHEAGLAKQIVAGQTHFTALLHGEVWTWGDVRYSDCLGREAGEDSPHPANKPGVVTDLLNLPTGPIIKIAAGGYATAALTEGNDLYIWGTANGLSVEPTPLDLEDKDFLDVGMGDDHMIVLATDQTVWVKGDGVNGQLGSEIKRTNEWQRVSLDLSPQQEIIGVAAGPRSSFLLVKIVT